MDVFQKLARLAEQMHENLTRKTDWEIVHSIRRMVAADDFGMENGVRQQAIMVRCVDKNEVAWFKARLTEEELKHVLFSWYTWGGCNNQGG